MPFLAPRILSHERAAWALSAAVGALVLAPAGPLASAVLAAICAASYAVAQPTRASSAADASRRAATAFAILASIAGAAALAASLSYRGPTVMLTALGVYVRELPFHAFLAYVAGAIFIGPLAREGHRLSHRGAEHDGWQRLVTTASLVGTVAMLPALAGAGRDADLAAVSALALAMSWLACLWVVASHASAHRLLARIRDGRFEGYRVRGPASPRERRTIAPLFSEYGPEQPMDALVRVDDVRTGAYREAPLEQAVALVPSPGAMVSRTSPALIAVVVPSAQALLLLLAWSL